MKHQKSNYYNIKDWKYYKANKKALMDLAEHGHVIAQILAF